MAECASLYISDMIGSVSTMGLRGVPTSTSRSKGGEAEGKVGGDDSDKSDKGGLEEGVEEGVEA